jgi:hypothetical protein
VIVRSVLGPNRAIRPTLWLRIAAISVPSWVNADLSRVALGYPETVRQLQQRLERCHPTNRLRVSIELPDAKHGRGPTVFDWLVDIINREPTAKLELR